MFTSDLANIFTSALANMFTSELEKYKKIIWPTCFLLKLIGEYVGLAQRAGHLIREKDRLRKEINRLLSKGVFLIQLKK